MFPKTTYLEALYNYSNSNPFLMQLSKTSTILSAREMIADILFIGHNFILFLPPACTKALVTCANVLRTGLQAFSHSR